MAGTRPLAFSYNTAEHQEEDLDHDARRTNVDIFGDEFAEDYADSIRTTGSVAENPFLDSANRTARTSQEDLTQRQAVAVPEISHWAPTRDSIKKSGNFQNDSDRVDRWGRDDTGHNDRHETQRLMSSAHSNRSSSAASSFSFAASRSSTQNPTGPSHQYGLYPQGLGVTRADSSASTSTGRPSRGSTRRGPLHPYTLYPQNAVVGVGWSDALPAERSSTYEAISNRRQPEIDQDSIRPDDHSEQLPAYTRYPDELHTKIAAGPPLTPTSNRTMTSEMQERPRVSPFADTNSTNESLRRSPPIINPFQDGEKSKDNSKKGWYRTKVLGFVPAWIILLVVGVVAVIAAICGGVIGSFINHRPQHQYRLKPQNTTSTTAAVASDALPVTTTTTQYIDASPISTPSSLAALPTGFFQLDIVEPASTANSSACLTAPAQRGAWSCDLSMPSPFSLEVNQNDEGAFVSIAGALAISDLSYGTQPPNLTAEPLELVHYLGNLSYGPAFHFQTYYNKLVILPGSALSSPTSQHKRNANLDSSSSLVARHIPDTDEPWFCWFNETLIEGFVFVNQTVPAPVVASSTAQASQAVASIPSSPTSIGASYQSTLTEAPSTPSAPPGPNTPFFTPMPSGASPPYSMPATWPPQSWPSTSCDPTTFSRPSYYSSPLAPEHSAGFYDPSSQTRRPRRQASPAMPTSTYFPELFRLEERRLSGAAPPSCTQMARLSDSTYAPIIINGLQIILQLNETDPQPNFVPYTSGQPLEKRDDLQEACFCLWET